MCIHCTRESLPCEEREELRKLQDHLLDHPRCKKIIGAEIERTGGSESTVYLGSTIDTPTITDLRLYLFPDWKARLVEVLHSWGDFTF